MLINLAPQNIFHAYKWKYAISILSTRTISITKNILENFLLYLSFFCPFFFAVETASLPTSVSGYSEYLWGDSDRNLVLISRKNTLYRVLYFSNSSCSTSLFSALILTEGKFFNPGSPPGSSELTGKVCLTVTYFNYIAQQAAL